MSETRVLEVPPPPSLGASCRHPALPRQVLEGEDGNTPLCKHLDDWSVVRVPDSKGGYQSLAVQKYKNSAHGPHGEMVIEGIDLPNAYLRGKCEAVYEEHEEALHELVKGTAPEALPAAVCHRLLAACPRGVDLETNADGKSLADEQADQGKELDAKAEQKKREL